MHKFEIMRDGVGYAPPRSLLSPPPSLNPSPSVTAVYPPTANKNNSMLVSVFLAFFLPCAGMSAVFVVYICLLWYATNSQARLLSPAKHVTEKGLSASELDKLPKVTGKELVMGTECAVCLDEVESEEPARVVPGCNHGFHLQCADTWLSKHSVCPVCRAKLDAHDQVFGGSHDQNPC